MKRARVSARVSALVGYQPGEQPADGKLVKLNTNENPYPPSPAVTEAVARAAAGLERYPPPLADPLREAASRRYGVATDGILAGNGSDDLINICLRACVVEGSTVAYGVPTYSLYRPLATIAGARLLEVEATPGKIPDELYSADAAVTFVCSPNSPFGTPVAVEAIARLAAVSDGVIVADEAYVDFAGESALPLVAEHDNLVVLRSFSKSFSLAGARLGLAFGDPDLIAHLIKVKDSYNVSRLDLAAGVAALEDYGWMEANIAKIVATRERTIAALTEMDFRVFPTAANFFWLDCGARGGQRVYEGLRAHGILVRFFDREGLRGGVRISVGTDDAMARLVEVLRALE